VRLAVPNGRARARVRGFSMVELMVAIVLGLLVTNALVAMFVGVRTAGRMSSGVSALSDSGRFALDTIEQNVRGAGVFACNATAPVDIGTNPITRQISLLNFGASPLVSDFGEPLAGYEAQAAGGDTGPGATITIANAPVEDLNVDDWKTTGALGAVLDGSLIAPPLPSGQVAPVGKLISGSDVLVMRETLPGTPPSYTTNVATGAGAFTISSATAFSSNGGQIGAITNCVQTEVFEVGGFTPGAGSGTVSLTGGGFSPGNTAGTLSGNIIFTIGAQVVPADTTVFYIGVGADGDGALFRWESNGGVLGDAYSVNDELVPDVENMQILYGIEAGAADTSESAVQYVTADQVRNAVIAGGGSPCNYTAAGEVAPPGPSEDFNCVISVRIALLVASPPGAMVKGTGLAASQPALVGTTLLGTNWALAAPDNRLRQVYEQTMFLRNMSQ
jgi:type IV pilus assembly protein PilW